MPGFFISSFAENQVNPKSNTMQKGVFREAVIDKFRVFQHTTNRFMNDKVFYEDAYYFILTEGVILNKIELLEKYEVNDIIELILKLIKSNNEIYFKSFRGSFSGCIYDKQMKEWKIYTNHYGDNTLFYYVRKDNVVISSQIDWILEELKANKMKISLDEKAVYYMLTYGTMADDCTYANEIKRLLPGNYIDIGNDGFVKVYTYYEMPKEKYNGCDISDEEAIEKIDLLFRQAVKREFEKDKEYNYKHLVQLSGGLDSRMNYWVSHEMGYHNALAINFCQSNYTDELVAKQIAEYWQGDILVWPLDSAGHLYDLEKCINMNYGTSFYTGVGGELRILENINIDKFGVMHTGQLGDVVIGTFIKQKKNLYDIKFGNPYYSHFLEDKHIDMTLKQYHNSEERLMYIRGFIGCLSSHFFTRQYTEVASPFCDMDFFDFCLSLPIEMRIRHNIYKKWINKKYPDAAGFIWERIQLPINLTDEEIDDILHKRKIEKKIEYSKMCQNQKMCNKNRGGMNPHDVWYENSSKLREFLDKSYEKYNRRCFNNSLNKDINRMFCEGNTMEKILVLTALSAVNYYFSL